MWTRSCIACRQQKGAYNLLLKELESEDQNSYTNFLRMSRESFDELLSLVLPYIKKKNTNMREAISAEERLAVTLRYLATGQKYAID